MDRAEFMQGMRTEVPELTDELDDDVWCGLLYLETGIFARYTQDAIESGDREKVRRCFEFARRSWLNGDDEVQNALGVAYIEHLNFNDGKKPRGWAYQLLAPCLQEVARTLGTAPRANRKRH